MKIHFLCSSSRLMFLMAALAWQLTKVADFLPDSTRQTAIAATIHPAQSALQADLYATRCLL
jgi:hypothetical protein